MGPIGTVRQSYLPFGYSRGKVDMQLTEITRVNGSKANLTALITVKHGEKYVTEHATLTWNDKYEGFVLKSNGVKTLYSESDNIKVEFSMKDINLDETVTLKINELINDVNKLKEHVKELKEDVEDLTQDKVSYEFKFSIAETDDINVTWYDADTNQDDFVTQLATLKTDDASLGTAIFATAVEDEEGNKGFISSETNFIADVSGSQVLGSMAIGGILQLEQEEGADLKPRIVKDGIKGTVREMIMTTINDVTYNFNRTLAISNYQLTYNPDRPTGYYPDIVYQTARGDKLTVKIEQNNMRTYKFDLIMS
jgi:hypothetical protein